MTTLWHDKTAVHECKQTKIKIRHGDSSGILLFIILTLSIVTIIIVLHILISLSSVAC